MNTGHLDTLARALEAAGLGGATPYDAASALLRALKEQPGGDEAHHKAHAAMLLRLPAPALTDLIASADVGGQQSILARLAHAGLSLEAILALLPKERTV